MKKIAICLSALFLLTVFTGTIYAKFKSGYEIVSKTENSVIIKGKNGEEISVSETSGKFKVGDKVKYDEKDKKITPEIEGC